MRSERAEDETDPAREKYEHNDRSEQARRLKIYTQVHYDPGEDDQDSDTQQQPTNHRLAVEEQDADTNNQRDQRETEHVVTADGPETTEHHNSVRQHVTAGYCHCESKKEFANAAWCAACAASPGFIVHAGIIAAFTKILLTLVERGP